MLYFILPDLLQAIATVSLIGRAAAPGSEERRVIRFDFVLVQWYK